MFLGRRGELQALEQLVEAVRGGESRALVLRGEAGVGKTALLDHLTERAGDFRVIRSAGVQWETELPFAAAQQLCAPLLHLLDRLPEPQGHALRRTFGLSADGPNNPFLVGLAVLGLLAEAAVDRPVLCVVDDAQWLDRASADVLAFVARRVGAESVALVFSVRTEDPGADSRDSRDSWDASGLPSLEVRGLADEDARRLLRSTLRGPVDHEVFDRIIAESRGNPLALLELPRALTPADLAGGLRPVKHNTVPQLIEESIRQQLQPLPADTRQLLILAAADPLGDPVLLWRAAETLGLGPGAPTAVRAAGLIDIGARVRFEHPLVRSTIYRAASADELRAAHRALAAATDVEANPDRRAWHAALATSGADDGIADDLEQAAERAQARGGLAAAAAFLERASALTTDPARRATRALAAAQVAFPAGSWDDALRLLSLAEAGPLDKLERAVVDLLRAQIMFAQSRGGNAAQLLLLAAAQLEPLDSELSCDTYLDAIAAAMFAGRFAADSVHDVAEAARAAPSSRHHTRASDLLLAGLTARFADGYGSAISLVRRALRAFDSAELAPDAGVRWLWLAHVAAVDVWADEHWEGLAERQVQLARETGSLTALPLALSMRIGAHVLTGELSSAAALTAELTASTEAIGGWVAPYGPLLLVAWQGREAETTELIGATVAEAQRRGEGVALSFGHWTQALLGNSLGRYEDALSAARCATEDQQERGLSTWGALVELVEAATRSGQAAEAAAAVDRLATLTRASGTDWALGLEARCRALVSHDDVAEPLYREAVERLVRTPIRGELARARLLYGEWLRSRGRDVDARVQLSASHEMFAAMGMSAFAERAAGEVRAAGGAVPKEGPDTTSPSLTRQEAQIARLVREGLTNVEIASRLFISPRTVEWHLGKVFAKLQISSRRELSR